MWGVLSRARCIPISNPLVGSVVVQTMIFLILLYLCFFSGPWNTLALPTDFRLPENFPTNRPQPIFTREDESRFETRSMYGILWSCLSTIFASTWIAVHPNIPAPGDSQWSIIRRRLAIMGYILLAPELVIFWVARQHFAARRLARKHQKKGWTLAHGFFLIMGGFTLHERGKPVRILEDKDLEELSAAGKIEWPKISKEEIIDRSKGDYLSKAIVLFQVIWFIVQWFTRVSNNLDIALLEQSTVSYAAVTVVVYLLWWEKPLDVRFSTPVQLLQGDIEKGDAGPKIKSISELSDQEIPEGEENMALHPNPTAPPTIVQRDTSTPDPALTRMQRFHAFRQRVCIKHGALCGLGYVFILFPLQRFFGAFADILGREALGDKVIRVPTFYSAPHLHTGLPLLFSFYVSMTFGGENIISSLSSKSDFATLQERWVWRISSILVLCFPFSIAAFTKLVGVSTREENKTTGIGLYIDVLKWIVWPTFYMCIIVRIVLIILSFMELRALSPGAYVQVNWVSFLPHI